MDVELDEDTQWKWNIHLYLPNIYEYNRISKVSFCPTAISIRALYYDAIAKQLKSMSVVLLYYILI